ncbi:hypothetical protein ACOME3_010332 [Neoechinorhynchus agilis]
MTSPNKNKLSPMDECERAFKRTLAQMPVPSWYANSVKNSRHSGGSDTHLHRRRSLESDSRIIKSTSMDEPAAGSNTEIPQPKWKSGTIGNPLAMRTPAVRRRVNNAGDIHWPDRKVTYLPMPGTECSLRSRPSLSSISGTANGTKAGYIPGSNNTVAQMSRWYKPKNLAVMAMKAKQAIPTDKHDSRRLKCSEPFSVPTENGTETCARSDGSNLPPYHTSGSLDGDNEVREIMGATAYTDDLTSETRSNKGNGILTFEPQKMPTIEHCVNAVQGHTTRPESTLPPSKFGTSSPPGQHTSTDDSYSFHTCLMGDQSSSSMYMSARETESGAESIARPLKTTNSKGTMNERLSRASESTLLPLDDSVDVNTSTASSQRDRKPTGLYDNLVSTTSKFGIRKYCGRINRTATREGDGQETQSGKQSSTRYCKTKDTSIQCKLQKTSTCPAVDYNRGDELLLATGIKQTPSSDIAILKQLVARIDQTFTKHDQALKAYTLSSAVSTEDGQIIDINCVPTSKVQKRFLASY